MSCRRTVVVIIDTETCEGCGRTALEGIQNEEFDNVFRIINYLTNIEDITPKSINIMELNDFVDSWNNSDCDKVEGSFETDMIETTFIGYCTVQN